MITLKNLRAAGDNPETSSDVAIKLAMLHGITLGHALLAIHDSPESLFRPLLERLVDSARSTLLSPHHSDSELPARRYYLRATTSSELPYDLARGYCPVQVSTHHPLRADGEYRPRTDSYCPTLAWTIRPEPRSDIR